MTPSVGTVFVRPHCHNRIDCDRPDSGELDTSCELPARAIDLVFDEAGEEPFVGLVPT